MPQLLLLCACATAPAEQYPLRSAALKHVQLPVGEFTAVLEVDVQGARSSYLLALRSVVDDLQLALLTPQGGPLYELVYQQGALAVTRKLASGDEPQAEVLLLQLHLIYADREALRSELASNWTMQQRSGARFFRHSNATGGIAITFAGDRPWYSKAQLIDSRHGTMLTIRIQEQYNALP